MRAGTAECTEWIAGQARELGFDLCGVASVEDYARGLERLPEWLAAITVAIAVSFVVLIFAERISRWVGKGVLAAFERLMGLLLTAIAVEMLLRGIEGFVRYVQRI